jgi:hypothetical protein
MEMRGEGGTFSVPSCKKKKKKTRNANANAVSQTPTPQVYEETGFDCSPYLNPEDFIEVTMQEQRITLYICPGVPSDTVFQTRTRKEISVSSGRVGTVT